MSGLDQLGFRSSVLSRLRPGLASCAATRFQGGSAPGRLGAS